MSVIYFRTDGNEQIATGHIMRCLSIARACDHLHAEVHFLVSDETSKAILEERFLFPDEFPVQCLHTDYRHMEEEIPLLSNILQGILGAEDADKPSANRTWLFVDSYFVTENYLSVLRTLCRTAYLDDMLAFCYPVDCIINYDVNGNAEPACYHGIPQKLLGAAYAPLREQFCNVPYQVRFDVQNILISTGGTDAYNIACEMLRRIFEDSSDTLPKQFHYHIITSRLNTHYRELQQFASACPLIHIHENVRNMAALMSECDLALSAGGTTLYELCAVGVPTVSFATADNQLTAAKTFSDNTVIPCAGDARLSMETVISEMVSFIRENSSSYGRRKKSSQKMRAFIDGNGAERIAAVLLK